jgi:hypothetical protein
MTELERARAHLRCKQEQLGLARALLLDDFLRPYEDCVLAALSWVWEEQEAEELDELAERTTEMAMGLHAIVAERIPEGRA